ncbi:MAG TPA: hypothetical protein DIT18_15250 [Pseudomonas sp.]|nr:hypothetical protein [Pseudomonas sp.]
MLAPDVTQTQDRITDAYSNIVGLDSFAMSCLSIRVAVLPDEPSWLPAVAQEVQQLDSAADNWQQQRAAVWAPTLLAFQDYYAMFSGLAGLSPTTNNNAGFWIKLLGETLLPQVQQSLAMTRTADGLLQQCMNDFSKILPQMNKSIEAGWNALGDEEQQMLQLTEQLGELVKSVQALGSKISSENIGSGKGIAQSAVSLLYEVGSAGAEASLPIAGVGMAVISIGDNFYKLISDDDQLIATMNQINSIKAQLSEDALGVALTKSTLQTLYRIEGEFLKLRDALPALEDLWVNQRTKIQDAIDALQAGAQPDQYLDLLTLPQAQAAWSSINTFVMQLSKTDINVGEPVTIDIAAATIRPTFPELARN